MLPKDVIKRVRHIEIATRRLVNDVFAGEYRSTYRGRGMEFSEVREYRPGDDIRSIDWNVTARTGEPHVKVFTEERELTVMLMVDLSGSGEFGTVGRAKRDLAVEVAALLAFAAIRNNDRVGLIAFTDHIEKYLPPKKGTDYGMRLISELVRHRPRGAETKLADALEYLMKVQRKKAVVFLVSDFLADDYQQNLKIVNRKHDLTVLPLSDPREESLPNVGLLWLEDAETGKRTLVDTSDRNIRAAVLKSASERKAALEYLLKSSDIDMVPLHTDQDYATPLVNFFRGRARKFR